MRTRSFLVLLFALIAASALLAIPAHPALAALAEGTEPGHPAPPATPAAFDQLKALTGTWQAKGPDGKLTMKASYEVYGNGTAVVETLSGMGESPMVTVYYPDGSQVMLTHYCTMGNQPRMRTSDAGSGKQLSFGFVDATNMKGADEAHMHALKITFADRDHFSQEWTMKKGGKDIADTFTFERTK
jgi:hypothetical protein